MRVRRRPEAKARQGFFPDGSRSFEEIDRFEIGEKGTGNLIAAKAEIDFYRILPPSGYTKGLPADPAPMPAPATSRPSAAASISSPTSPRISAHRRRGRPWLAPPTRSSRSWRAANTTAPSGPKAARGSRRRFTGLIFSSEQRVFAARAVQKADARLGGYVTTGEHGGILGAAGHDGPPLLHYLPTARHTWRSEVNVTRLPSEVGGVRREGSRTATLPVAIRGPDGGLFGSAIPKVVITKDASYWDDEGTDDPETEVDLVAMIGHMLKTAPLAGFVVEGLTPYGGPS
jgi:L-asparaginase